MEPKKLWLFIALIIIGLITTTSIVSASGLRIERIDWYNPHHYGIPSYVVVWVANDGYAIVSGTAYITLYRDTSQPNAGSRAVPISQPHTPNYVAFFRADQPYSINGPSNHVNVRLFFPGTLPKGDFMAELTGLGPEMFKGAFFNQ